ncbi:hydrogenase nickel incorporation protein HypB [Mucilaginibacter sp. UR6-11]|uniref:hydrogenase nickel incorporation protein HypB n=1 Tax=Mucilaginibacter sp. UR6-11 TaxID=1435644 RepID=UPI001E3591C9|nr:hydrogenase nickel incorporation protein HypB [Mucilaginibacter sp. UR6-11]MCC8423511.1 hydrogenase nickel incorporation protein HypB [Mucilaginibacter sp. UR6-11]
MCATCGCDSGGKTTFRLLDKDQQAEHDHKHVFAAGHDHAHSHFDSHDHVHNHSKTIIEVEQDVLLQNNLLAQRNRGYFDAKNILALNLVSSPGSGKTSLLERTLTDLKGQLDFAVIEGDQQTTNDADRIQATGTDVTQINTGKGCHLDAHMILHALQGLKPKENSVLLIENVGNLVCPAMFDLGEKERIVIISVTEGDDKPLKYPDMFHSSTLCIINKTDLLPYVPFDIEKVKANAKKINHHLEIIEVSCTTGEGLQVWYNWLKSKVLLPETT